MAHVSVSRLVRGVGLRAIESSVRRYPRTRRSERVWRRLVLWLPVAVYAAGIFFASSISNPALPAGVSDKTGHGLAYFGLALLVLRGLAGAEWAGVTARTSLGAVALAVAYGASDELHQLFVPGRTADVHDLRADATGAAIGVALVWLLVVIRRRRESRI
jgi:VanZ family protein